ncbi:MAG TPA: carbamoyl-phosphate synthase large subunit, partial [Gaiellaceae bacterium]|nr:carbamoyl-phosphate synthase large subunit [Gaiellaceae bacterium]
MPKRQDLRSILIAGSGPIRIGQGCEFDYAGVQACRALRAEGYRVVLVNSNPATIMTDPEWADATYLEPLDAITLAEIVARERPDAFLPTLGGQTALNLAVELAEAGVLAEHGVELIGADLGAIRRAEDRSLFRATMEAAGLPVPPSVVVTSLAQLDECPLPAVVRPAFTLGGRGGGLARTRAELERRVARGLEASPIGQVLVERSLEGRQEFELELVADTAGNCVVVCSIENLDPVGVHTGDSWTVAPQQTLPDGELQRLRDAAFACVRAIGVATGGANVQFAYDPETRELDLIEMNPRVSRSSALASKATGYPIAKLAALLAVGYTLDELPNDITGASSAAFEPALDYVAVKAPRFDFDKFPGADTALGTEMRAVGESLGLGRTFPEALLKALEGVEAGDRLPEIPGLHPYFAAELDTIRAAEAELAAGGDVAAAKRFGLPDSRIARVLGIPEAAVRGRRGLPGRLAVDSCAGEFEARTPYYYLSHEPGDGHAASTGAIVVLGSGANRIGQGIEFDYCCVRAAQAFRALGHEVVLVNSNPETVSTDYDTCDRLYLEPLTLETVIDVAALEQPLGVAVSFGGQTPIGLAHGLAEAGVPLLGDPLESIDAAE